MFCVCMRRPSFSPGLWAPSVDGPPPGREAPASYLEETRQQWGHTHMKEAFEENLLKPHPAQNRAQQVASDESVR